MITIANDLITERDLDYLTAMQYITTLRLLNDDVPFKSLTFLRNHSDIIERLERTYAPSSVKTKLGQIVSVLSLFPNYTKIKDLYHDALMSRAAALQAEEASGEKNAKQKETWISWEDVLAKRDELVKTKPSGEVTQSELLDALVISLYTYIAPRRNKDYLKMYIIPEVDDTLYPTTVNYLVLQEKKMIFNTYKTSATYGQQVLDIPNPLWSVFQRFYATIDKKASFFPIPLIQKNGKHYSGVSSITDILNRIFGKKIGASALRHIYLSDKYADNTDERNQDSKDMAHSRSQQDLYIKRHS